MTDYYELDKTLHEYLAFHYPDGDPLEPLLGERTPPISGRFPVVLRELWEPRPDGIALDVGAACGRMTVELAANHRHAIGLDLAKALIRGAEQVRRAGRARYRTWVEGEEYAERDVAVEGMENTSFLVGNALSLPFPDAHFDTVLALNLIDRVPDPKCALDELTRTTKPGGTLIVASPYTWLEEFTPKEQWLVGVERVRAHLAETCEVDEARRYPFFIPHHTRSGQLGQSIVVRATRR